MVPKLLPLDDVFDCCFDISDNCTVKLIILRYEGKRGSVNLKPPVQRMNSFFDPMYLIEFDQFIYDLVTNKLVVKGVFTGLWSCFFTRFAIEKSGKVEVGP